MSVITPKTTKHACIIENGIQGFSLSLFRISRGRVTIQSNQLTLSTATTNLLTIL